MPEAPPWSLAVDLGTTSTVVVAAPLGGAPEVVEVDGRRRTPSVAFVPDDGRIVVGAAAEQLAPGAPARLIRAPKTRLGDPAPAVVEGRSYRAVDLVAALLRHVAGAAVDQRGRPPSTVRLTHPASWPASRTAALVEAAAAAGLGPVELVSEPVAAALGHAERLPPGSGPVLVHDLGGGTFDTAAVDLSGPVPVLLGRPGGSPVIGGDLFDELVAGLLLDRLPDGVAERLRVDDDPMWRHAAGGLRAEARRVKELLSIEVSADALVAHPEGMAQVTVTRPELEALVGPSVDETVALLRRCAAMAGLDAGTVRAVLLVGGAGQVPLVAERIAAALPGVELVRSPDPKAVVALGAARPTRTPPSRPAAPAPSPARAPAPRVPVGWPAMAVTGPGGPPSSGRPETTPAPAPVPVPTRAQRLRRTPLVAAVMVVLAGALAAGSLWRPGGDDDERVSIDRPDTTTTDGVDTTTTTEADATGTTLAESRQVDLEQALMNAGDVPAGFLAQAAPTEQAFVCDSEPDVDPLAEARVDFLDDQLPPRELRHLNQAYASSEEAAEVFAANRDVLQACRSDEIVLDGVRLTVEVGVMSDDQVRDLAGSIPTGCEDLLAVAFLLSEPASATPVRALLELSVRCGQVVTSLQLGGPDEASLADAGLVDATVQALTRSTTRFAPA